MLQFRGCCLRLDPGRTPVRSAGSLSARRRSASQQELSAPSPLYGSLGELVRVRPGGRIRRPWEWVLRPAWWMNSTATAERQIRMRQPRASSQNRYCDALEVDCSPLRLRDGARHSGKRRRGRAERACGTASNHVHFASPSSKLSHQTASSTTDLPKLSCLSPSLFSFFVLFFSRRLALGIAGCKGMGVAHLRIVTRRALVAAPGRRAQKL